MLLQMSDKVVNHFFAKTKWELSEIWNKALRKKLMGSYILCHIYGGNSILLDFKDKDIFVHTRVFYYEETNESLKKMKRAYTTWTGKKRGK